MDCTPTVLVHSKPCTKKVMYGGAQKLINKLKILISNSGDMHSPNGTI